MIFGKEASIEVITRVSILNSQEDATTLIREKFNTKVPVVLSFINAHAYNLCWKDLDFANAMLSSDVVLRDGIGMQMLYKSLGVNSGANLNGTDYIPALLEQLRGSKIALLGTDNPYLGKAAEKLLTQGHNIVLTETGFHPDAHYLEILRKAEPDVIILGMGMPKQEKLSIILKENLGSKCLIINGGAIIDFWGRKVARAPSWMRRLNMEWVYRLILEPRRLFSRYVIGNYVFLKRTQTLKHEFTKAIQGHSAGQHIIRLKTIPKKVDQHAEV